MKKLLLSLMGIIFLSASCQNDLLDCDTKENRGSEIVAMINARGNFNYRENWTALTEITNRMRMIVAGYMLSHGVKQDGDSTCLLVCCACADNIYEVRQPALGKPPRSETDFAFDLGKPVWWSIYNDGTDCIWKDYSWTREDAVLNKIYPIPQGYADDIKFTHKKGEVITDLNDLYTKAATGDRLIILTIVVGVDANNNDLEQHSVLVVGIDKNVASPNPSDRRLLIMDPLTGKTYSVPLNSIVVTCITELPLYRY